MREYWTAWSEILELAGEFLRFAIEPIVLPSLAVLVLAGWITGECLLMARGDYWQAAAVFGGSIVLGLLISGHILARMLMKDARKRK